MGPRFVRLALVLFTLLAVGALGAGVYASGEGADVFGVATTTTVPPTTKPPATTTTTLKPSPSPSPSPTVSATDTVDPALTADEELLKPGTTGPAVLALEKRLKNLRFDLETPDDTYDEDTVDAVLAYQKLTGLDRDGVAGPKTRHTLADKQAPVAPMATGAGVPASRVEVDLDRQVLLLWENGQLDHVISVSTGSGQWFVVEEEFRVSIAVTNAGSFEVGRKYDGWEKGPLGEMYKPMYFDGGIAIHGSPSVPPYPASHGCVRTPIHTQEWLYPKIPSGFPVYVFGESPGPTTDRPPTPTRPTTPPPPTDTAPAATSPPADATPTAPPTTTAPPPDTTTTSSTAAEATTTASSDTN